MSKHISILALTALSFTGLVNTVRAISAKEASFPTLNVEAGCKDVTNKGVTKSTDYSGCLADERKARDDLQKDWESYPADVQSRCVHLVSPPALPSYITLRQCLVTAREADKMMKTDGQPDIKNAMEPRRGE